MGEPTEWDFSRVLDGGIPVSKFPGGWGIGKKRILILFFSALAKKISVLEHFQGETEREMKKKRRWVGQQTLRGYMRLFVPLGIFSSGFSYGTSTHSDSQNHGTLKNDCFVASFRAWRRQGCVGNETTKPSCLGEGVEGVSASGQGGGGTEGLLLE